jgi:hypothetical protein
MPDCFLKMKKERKQYHTENKAVTKVAETSLQKCYSNLVLIVYNRGPWPSRVAYIFIFYNGLLDDD